VGDRKQPEPRRKQTRLWRRLFSFRPGWAARKLVSGHVGRGTRRREGRNKRERALRGEWMEQRFGVVECVVVASLHDDGRLLSGTNAGSQATQGHPQYLYMFMHYYEQSTCTDSCTYNLDWTQEISTLRGCEGHCRGQLSRLVAPRYNNAMLPPNHISRNAPECKRPNTPFIIVQQ
jgi:hypothetical protein